MVMNSAGWFLLVGGLMLAMGLATPTVRRLPVNPAMVYLAVGLVVGPTFLGLFHFNPLKQSALLEVLTEVAVLIALFSAGVKMPVPVTFARWRTPVFLAVFSMTATVALIAGYAHYILGLSLGAAVLLGAIIAPTDPVLATDTQIRSAEDRDRLRFTLTCEAGMNDGSAFPFVMLGMGLLGLRDLGEFGQRWVLVDVVWATLTGIAIGVVAGWVLAHVSARLRSNWPDRNLWNDFLGLGLIGVVYGLSLWLNAWGFLAVFFAAVSLRHTELNLAGANGNNPSRSRFESRRGFEVQAPKQHVSAASLVFKEHLERLSELVLILLVGGMLFVDSWSWPAVGLALFIFLIARPFSVMIGLIGTRSTWRIRGLVGWFGVRGIGSLYYLMYAIGHGLQDELALELLQLTLVVVTLSILIHGITAKPMMSRFWNRKRNVC